MSQKFTDWSATASNNTVVGSGGIDIAENCAPGNVNDALREIMAACVRSAGLIGLTGTSRPAGVQSGQTWWDTTTATAPIWKYYDGTDDIAILTVNTTTNTVTFGSAVTFTINIVDDTTPQLGGDLDVNGFQITSASNGNVTIDPDGTGKILIGADVFFEDDQDTGFNYVADGNFTIDVAGAAVIDLAAGAATHKKQAKSSIKTLTSSTGITVTMTDENVQFVELDHNATFTISGDAAGQWVTLIIKQGSTGGTGTFSGVDVWLNGGSAPTLSTTTGEYDIVSMFVAAGPTVIASHTGP